MKKSRKRLFPVLFVFLALVSVYYFINTRTTSLQSYQYSISQARQAAQRDVLVDALQYYEEAITLQPSPELYAEVGEMYLSHEEYASARSWYSKEMMSAYPKNELTYEIGMKASLAEERIEEAFEIYDIYQTRGLYSNVMEDLINQIRYTFSLKGRYEDAGVYIVSSQRAPVKTDGLWGYAGLDGDLKIRAQYLETGIFTECAPVVDENGEAYFIDSSGNKKITADYFKTFDPGFGKITRFKGMESGFILATDGQVWNYYDAETYEEKFGGYKDATLITNGVGAVSDGSRWALISAEGNLITDYVYDEVLADGKGFVCRTEGIIVCRNGEYTLVDRSGKTLSRTVYEDARAFYDSTYAAVKKAGRWIFINEKGEELDLGDYQEAESFSDGLAAVKNRNLWGYINLDGEQAIDYQFKEAGPICTLGVGFVKTEEEVWRQIGFYSQIHE